MAKLGVGLLVIPQKPWESVKQDFETYHRVWREVNGAAPVPRPLCGAFVFVDEDGARAKELGLKYISDYYGTAMRHYEMTSEKFGTHKGYEFYGGLNRYIAKRGMDGAAHDFANLMPWGSPDEVLEKLAFIRDFIGANGFMVGTSYAGMPPAEAERNLRCFAKHVLPQVKSWQTEPLAEPREIELREVAASA
jgi:hypothetical protein